MSKFICPVCSNPLEIREKSFVCAKNHSFDIASKGYVNLLCGTGKTHGDDKEMVRARSSFLSRGYYSHLKDALVELSKKYAPKSPTILDCGCGEGYYTEGLSCGLDNAEIYGIDISRDAVVLAKKRVKEGNFAVASSFKLPIEKSCADLLINCFSPLCIEEFSRVLKTGGTFLYVVPAPKHLWQLKCLVYDAPYENQEKRENYDGFELVEAVKAEREITLASSQELVDLFTMTPYFYTSPKGTAEKLKDTQNFTVNAHFIIYAYKKM